MEVSKISSKTIKQYQNLLTQRGVSESTIKRKLSSMRKFSGWLVKEGYLKKDPLAPRKKWFPQLFYRPRMAFQAQRALPYFTYLNFLILAVFLTALGWGLYQQFVTKAPSPLAYPGEETRPYRYLSFQGRLTDSGYTPITGYITMRFSLYDLAGTGNPPTGGTLLWDSDDCTVDPDQDGIFAILLGTASGDGYTCTSAQEIPGHVFSENAEVWLHIKVGSEELDPRIQIATVAYALNAETLQGFPLASAGSATPEATMGATARTVPAINPAGNLVIASDSPTIWSTSGTFGIKGQAITIQTDTGTGGNITLAPDGTGVLNIVPTSGNQIGGTVNATNSALTTGALYTGRVENDNTGFDFLRFFGGSTPSEKFSVGALGSIDMANNLDVGGAATITGTLRVDGSVISDLIPSGTRDLGSSGSNWDYLYVNSIDAFTLQGAVTGNSQTITGLEQLTVNNLRLDGNTLDSTTGDLTLLSAGELYFDDTRTGAIPFSSSDTALNAALTQAIIDAINDVYDAAVGTGGISGFWSKASGVIYPNNTYESLAIGGTSTTSAQLYFEGTTGNASMSGDLTLAGGGTIGATDMNNLTLGNSSTQNVIINPNGNVGIGTTAPGAKLDVAGNATISGTLALGPQTEGYAGTCDASAEGKMYYDATYDQVLYCNGTKWQADRTTATLIVAANDSQNKYKADYVCDGTNDEVQIEAAISALPNGGGAVHLLDGTYNIGASIDITKSNVSLIGAGNSTILSRVDDGFAMIVVGDGGDNAYEGIVIANLQIDGQDDTYQDNANNHGIFFNQQITESRIENNWIHDCRAKGIYLDDDSLRNTIKGNAVYSGSYLSEAIYLSYASSNVISGNNIRDNLGDGIELSYSTYNLITNNSIKGNYRGIYLKGYCDNNIISNNVIEGQTVYNGIYVSTSDNNIISDNKVQSNTSTGIDAYRSNNNLISGNFVYNNGGTGSTNAIAITSDSGRDCDYNVISNNRIYDYEGTSRAISINQSYCDDNYIFGNEITGTWNSAGPISDAGTGTKYTQVIAGNNILAGSSGNVGIGTTTPTAKLEVVGDASVSGSLVFRGTTPSIKTLEGKDLIFQFSQGGDAGLATKLTLDADGDITFSGSANTITNANQLTLSTSGASSDLVLSAGRDITFDDDNLASAVPLSVADSALNASLAQGIIDAINDAYDAATGAGGIAGFWTKASGVLFPNNTYESLAIGGTSTASAKLYFEGTTGDASMSGNLTLAGGGTIGATDMNDLTIGDSSTQNVIINPNGNVGIGTTEPGAKLDVRGSAIFNEDGTDADFRVESDKNSNIFVIDSGRQDSQGAVGIGSNPGSFAHVFISAPATSFFGDFEGDPNYRVHIDNSNIQTLANNVDMTDFGSLRIDEPNVAFGGVGSIDNAFTVKITGAPTEGDANYALWVDDGVSRFDGNVGIGTTAPVAPLHISGSYGSNAALIVDQLYSGDILTASASATTVARINNSGDILTAGTLQAGSATSEVAYNRLGTGTANFSDIGDASDLLISDALEVQGIASISALLTPYHHVITVAKQGGDFTTITAALSSITDNSSTNTYLIRVMPGTYEEAITMKEYVDIIGSGWEVTKITQVIPSANGSCTTETLVCAASNSLIKGFEIILTGNTVANSHTIQTVSSASNYRIEANKINCTYDAAGCYGIVVTHGTGIVRNNRIGDTGFYTGIASPIVHQSGTLYLENNYLTTRSDSGTEACVIALYSSTINSFSNAMINCPRAFQVESDGGSPTINSYKDNYTGTAYITGTGTFNKKDYALAPLADASQAVLPMWVTAPTTLSSSGTYLGVNAAGGYTGDYINLLLNDSSKFKVDYQGELTSGNILPLTGDTYDLGSGSAYWDNLYVNNIYGSSSGTQGFWTKASGLIYPNNTYESLAIGGTSTSSASLYFEGTTGNASMSGDLTLAGGGTIGATDMNNLTLGDSSTQNVIINPSGQLRLAYDGSNYASFTVANDGDLTVKPTGSGQVIFQPTTDSATFLQVLDANGGEPILNINSTSEYVGIGTTSIGAKLEIRQTSGSPALRIETGSPADLYWLDIRPLQPGGANHYYSFDVINGGTTYSDVLTLGKGKVGIGTTALSAELTIVGDASIAGDASMSGSLVFRGTTPSIKTLGGKDLIFQFSQGGDAGLATKLTLDPDGDITFSGSANTITNANQLTLSTTGATSDLVLSAGRDITFDDDNLASPVPLSVADSALNASLAQGIIDAINDAYDAAVGTGGISGFWSKASGLIYPNNAYESLAIGGTSTASAQLYFEGTTGNASMSGNLTLAGGGTIGATDMNNLTLGDSSTQNIIINPNGNVGIGNSAPERTLHVGTGVNNVHYAGGSNLVIEGGDEILQIVANDSGNRAAALALTNTPTSGDNKHWVFHHRGPSSSNVLSIGYNTTSATSWDAVNSGSILNLATGGYVGIRTESPQSRLHIQENQAGPALTIEHFKGTGDISNHILGDINFSGTDESTFSTGARIRGVADGEWNTGADTTDSPGRLEFATVPDGSDTLSTRMVIKNDGTVGIGTTAPVAPLHISKGYGSNAALIVDQLNSGDILTASASATTVARINNSGDILTAGTLQAGSATSEVAYNRLGTGTANFSDIGDASDLLISDALEVGGNATFSGTLSLGPQTEAYAGTCIPAAEGKMYYDAGQNKYYYCNGSAWTAVGTGIGVGGSGNENYIPKWSSSSDLTDSIIYEESSKIGIGTTEPSAELDVEGDASVSGSLVFRGTTPSIKTLEGKDLIFQFSQGGDAGLATKLTLDPDGDITFSGSANTITNANQLTLSTTGASSDLVLSAGRDITFDDDNLASPVALSVADSGLNAALSQGIIDAINEAYDAATGAGGSSAFWTKTSGLLFPNNTYESLAVGGTSTSSASLYFEGTTGNASMSGNLTLAGGGTIGATDMNNLTIGDSSTQNIIINPNGNVGIGTTNPSDKLTVSGNVKASNAVLASGTGFWGNKLESNGGSDLSLYGRGSIILRFDSNADESDKILAIEHDSGTELFRINESGNVGIGTTAPVAPLHVSKGYGSNAALIIDQLNSGDILTASASATTVARINNSGDILTSGTLQAGSATSEVAYNRLGTGTANFSDIGDASDLLVSDALEVQGTASISALLTPYHHVITVAKQGGDFTTISAALSSITDNSSSNTYLIRVMPGTYDEQVTMKDYIDIIGSGWEVTKITKTDDVVVSTSYPCTSRIEGFTIQMNDSSANNKYLFYISGATSPVINKNFFTYSGGTAGLSVRHDGGSGTNAIISNNIFSNVYMGLFLKNGTPTVIGNIIESTSVDISTYNDTATVTINSYNNVLKGSGSSFYVYVNATVNSHNDTILGGITNTGTFNKKDYYLDPLASASQAVLPLGARAYTGGSVGGTYLGINSAASYYGDFLNFLNNGTSRFKVGGFGDLSVNVSTASAALTLDQSGVGLLLTASTSGTTVANLDTSGNLEIEGALSDLSDSTLSINDNLSVTGNILPSTGDTYDLGSTTAYWDNLYVNNIYGGASGTQGFWSKASGLIYPNNAYESIAIGGTSTTSAQLYFEGTTGNASMSGDLTLAGGGTIGATDMNDLTLGDSSTQNVIINPNSYVGIGTTEPGAKLEVAIPGSGPGIQTLSSGGIGGVRVARNAETSAYIEMMNYAWDFKLSAAPRSTVGDLIIETTSGNMDIAITPHGTGNVDISSGDLFVEGSSGNVGIGTTDPGAKLTVLNGDIVLREDDDGNDAVKITAGTGRGWIEILEAGLIRTKLTAEDSYFVGKNVGIGTTSPISLLHVEGGVTGKALAIFDETEGNDIFTASASGSPKFVIKNSGNVGIGTTDPQEELDIAGDATISGTLSLGPQTQAYAGICDASAEGKMYYDAGQNKYYFCNGNDWTEMGSGAGGGTSWWTENLGLLYPVNSTLDLAIGGTSTESAKFAFTNMATGTPTATFSGDLVLAGGARTISATDMNTLTIGDASTGDIQFYSSSNKITSAGNLIIAGDLTVGGGDITGTGDEKIDIGEETANTIQMFIDAVSELTLTADYLQPTTNAGLSLGQDSNEWQDLWIDGTAYLDALTMQGAIAMGGNNITDGGTIQANILEDNDDTILAINDNLSITGNILPSSGDTYDLGATTAYWDNLYVNNVYGVSGGTQGFWTKTNGLIYPNNAYESIAIGGTSTASAQLYFEGTTGDASMAGTLTIGQGETIRPAYGPLQLAYKSGADTWTTGMVMNESGYVGIGTTEPEVKLHVSGGDVLLENGQSIFFEDTSNNNDAVFGYNSSNNIIIGYGVDSSNDVRISPGSGAKLTVQGGGNVGIGTTSPDNLLSLNEASGDVILDFDLNDADKWVIGIDDGDNDYFKINSGNTLTDPSDFEFEDDGDLVMAGDLTVSGGDITGTGDEKIDIGEETANTIQMFIDAVSELTLTATLLQPSANAGLSLGQDSNEWQDLWIDGTAYLDALTMQGAIAMGGNNITDGGTIQANTLEDNDDTILALNDNLSVTGNILPSAGSTYDLGAAGTSWANVYTDNLFGGTSGTLGFWTKGSGVLYPNNTYESLVIGGTSTASAQLYFDGTDGDASMSGVLTLFGASPAITTTNMRTLTLGDASTGNIIIYQDLQVNGNDILDSTSTTRLTLGTTTTVSGNLTVTQNLKVDTDTLFVDSSTHRVGIGTTDPQAKLDIAGASSLISNSSGDITLDASSGYISFSSDYISNLGGVYGDLNVTGNLLNSTAEQPLKVSDWMLVQTSTPSAALMVDQTGVGDIFTASTSGVAKFTINNAGRLVNSLTPAATNTYDLGSSTYYWKDLYLEGSTIYFDDTTDATLKYDTSNSYFAFDPDGDATPNVVMTDAGNVGIGTTNPGQKLTLEGTAPVAEIRSGGYLMLRNTANDWDMRLQSFASTKLGIFSGGDLVNPITTFVNGGNVGIGTTNPSEKLDVAGNLRGTGNLYLNNASPTIYFQDTDNYSGMIHVNSNLMYILTGSGINSTSWTQHGSYWPLAVNMTTDEFVFGGEAYFMEGNVGIGTTGPGYPLVVEKATEGLVATFATTNSNTSPRVRIIGNGGTTYSYATFELARSDSTSYWSQQFRKYSDSPNDMIFDYYNGSGWNRSLTLYYDDGHADIAETIHSLEPTEKGDLLSITNPQGESTVKITDKEYDNNLIGVVSTRPGLAIGDGVGAGAPDHNPNRPLISLAGRVSVKVISMGTPIALGEKITSSPLKGYGMKATKIGKILGSTLEKFEPNDAKCPVVLSLQDIIWPDDQGENEQKPCFKLPDGNYVGKIMVFVNVSWYDPDVYLTDTGDLSIQINPNEDSPNESEYSLVNNTGQTIERIGAFGQAIIAQLRTGLIEAQEIITGRLVSTEIETGKLISPVVETETLTSAQIIAENIETTRIDAEESEFGKLLIKSEEGETVASIDSQGNASFGGLLEATAVTSDQLSVTGDATVAGTLYADHTSTRLLEVDELRVAGEIIGRKATFGDLLAATISASTIDQAELDEIEQRLSELEGRVSPSPAPEPTATPTLEPTPTPTESPEASGSGDLDSPDSTDSGELEGWEDWSISDPSNDILLTSDITITGDLTAYGITSLADTTIAGQLMVDATIIIDQDGIQTLPGSTLKLQAYGWGGIDMLGGKVVIDTEGNVLITGDLVVAGNIATGGLILSETPLEALESQEASESGFGKLLAVINKEGVEVASIDASGSAFFAQLGIEADYNATQSGAIIAAAENYYENGYLAPAIKTNATAGIGILPAYEEEVMIYNPQVTGESLIYVTATTNTENKVLYVKAKKATACDLALEGCRAELDSSQAELGWFIVALNEAIDKDVQFNWWIIGGRSAE